MNAQTFDFREFLARSSDDKFDELTLVKVLSGLPPLASSGPWLGGGALRRTILGTEPDSDFDFFFRDAAQLAEFGADIEGRGFYKVRESEHHIEYRGNVGGTGMPRDVQCIRFAFYQNVEAVIDSFDFTICQFAFDGARLMCGEFALWDLGRKRLAVHRLTYPVSSMRRMLKYASQGFRACSGAIATILRETASNPALLAAMGIAYVD
jgi:hypothetical protein